MQHIGGCGFAKKLTTGSQYKQLHGTAGKMRIADPNRNADPELDPNPTRDRNLNPNLPITSISAHPHYIRCHCMGGTTVQAAHNHD